MSRIANAPRRLATVGLAAVALAVAGAAPALAAQRYAAPTPAGMADCSTPANACDFVTAVNGAAAGDEVIVASGDYGSPVTPLTVNAVSFGPNVYIHGVLDQPRPRIFSSASFPVTLHGPGSTLRWLEIDDSSASGGPGIDIFDAVVERVVVNRTVGSSGNACRFSLISIAIDDVCHTSSASGLAVLVSGVVIGPNTVTLRNLTAIADAAGGIGAYVESAAAAGRSTAVTMINTVARGGVGGFDLRAARVTQPDTLTTSHSNYVTTSATGGATITDDGTSQTAAPVFAAPLTGDFHELSGSPTINAGISDPANGGLDADGAARTQGASTDIGAYEFPSPVPPGAAPTQQAPIQQIRKKCKKRKKHAASAAKKRKRCGHKKKHR